jgi:hypothetical protein
MKQHKIFFGIFLILMSLGYSFESFGKVIFAYHRLVLKDLEQMDRFIRAKIKESQNNQSEQISHLVDAMVTLFSRPNLDNMVEKLAPVLLSELSSQDLTKVVFHRFVEEALQGIRSQNHSYDAQITYVIALENWIVEMKNRLNDEIIYSLFEKIAFSEVTVSKKARQSSQSHIPYDLPEPVTLTKKILKEFNEKKEKQEKQEKQEELGKQENLESLEGQSPQQELKTPKNRKMLQEEEKRKLKKSYQKSGAVSRSSNLKSSSNTGSGQVESSNTDNNMILDEIE